MSSTPWGVQAPYATEVETVTAAPTTAGTAPSARATRKTAARKAPARPAPAKKTTTRKSAAKKTTARKPASNKTAEKALAPARRPPRFNRRSAAEHAIHKHTIQMTLPVLGPVTLPAPEKLAFFAGLATVAALGIVDWPVVAVISVGHLMAENQRNRLVRDFGMALEEAV